MNINQLNLNLIRVFAAIFESGTLTRAAEQLNLSQPGVSHALKQLRETFDDELFVRGTDGYLPTTRARELAPAFLKSLGIVSDAIKDNWQFDPASAKTVFHISASDYSSHAILPDLFTALDRQAPFVRCSVSQLSAEVTKKQLKNGKLDLAILSRLPGNEEPGQQLLRREEPCCVIRADSPLVTGQLTLKHFTEMQHIIVQQHGELESAVDRKLTTINKSRTVRFSVPYFNSVAKAVSTTDLIGTLPRHLANDAASRYPIEIHALPFAFPPIDIITAWHPRRERDPELKWLREVIAQVCGEV